MNLPAVLLHAEIAHISRFLQSSSPLQHMLKVVSKMVTYLKRTSLVDGVGGHQVDVPKTVQGVINDIRTRGDEAVRSYSEKYDKWAPTSFKLSKEDIETVVAKVPKATLDDIKTVQDNVRRFALAQRETIKDLEIEIRPGVFLGHKNIPVSSVGA